MRGAGAITVGDLRYYLAQFDQTLPCYFSECSNWSPLGSEDIHEYTMIDKGGWVDYADPPWNEKQNPLQFQAVLFPGN